MNIKAFLLPALLAGSIFLSGTALASGSADISKQIELLQQQIRSLQHELNEVKAAQVKQGKQVKQVAAQVTPEHITTPTALTASEASAATGDSMPGNTDAAAKTGSSILDKIKLTPGGFIEAAGIYRQHNMGSDIATGFSSIPYPYLPTAHMHEFRETARQSRLSLLAEGATEEKTNLAAYFEFDFLGAAQTANSKESNSYNPRIRQIYATADDNLDGWHFLGGQAWSMITLNKEGITPRKEDAPLTIDAQYVPGFTWTRNPQFRVVKTFDDHKLSAGLSLESPQAIPAGTAPSGTTYNISGGSGYFNTTTYSTDLAPDIIGKLAFDPGFGHYEVYGLGRFFTDRNHGANSTVMGGGAGAAAIVPIIKKKLDFQISGLAGKGIGRYGTSQLPDVTFKPDGDMATIGEVQALAGLIGHPDEQWDLYLYGGTERAQKKAFGTIYGYGNSAFNNSGCLIEGDAASSCVANTSAISEITAGAWWKFYKGKAGMMEFGAQDSYTTRDIFRGIGGSPSTNENITMVSFRYYPF